MYKLNLDQFEACAYLFEREHGRELHESESELLRDVDLPSSNATELEEIITSGIDNRLYGTIEERASAYWSLTKRHNTNLIPHFTTWLKNEFEEENHGPVYQLLIALGNLDVEVFGIDREGSTAGFEIELNMRDAEEYLKKKKLLPT